jgi:hypothetical protein
MKNGTNCQYNLQTVNPGDSSRFFPEVNQKSPLGRFSQSIGGKRGEEEIIGSCPYLPLWGRPVLLFGNMTFPGASAKWRFRVMTTTTTVDMALSLKASF